MKVTLPTTRRRLLRAGVATLIAFSLTLGTVWPAGKADGAGRVNEVLQRLKQPKASSGAERFELSEADLNAFVGVLVAARKTSGLQSLLLDLRPQGVISGVAVVDMDRVALSGMFVEMFKSVLSGTQTIKTTGRLSVTGRRAEFEVESASFNGIWVPAWLVHSLMGRLGARQPDPIDVTAPFDLPFGITDVRTESDRLVIIR